MVHRSREPSSWLGEHRTSENPWVQKKARGKLSGAEPKMCQEGARDIREPELCHAGGQGSQGDWKKSIFCKVRRRREVGGAEDGKRSFTLEKPVLVEYRAVVGSGADVAQESRMDAQKNLYSKEKLGRHRDRGIRHQLERDLGRGEAGY